MQPISIFRRPARRAAGLAALAALAAAAAAPGAASADATIGWNHNDDPLHATSLYYYADQGRVDHVKVTTENGRTVFRSTTEHLTTAKYNVQYSPAFTQCNQGPDLKTVVCEDQDVDTVYYWTWDGNDTVDHQSPIHAEIDGGKGNDTLYGGDGNDSLYGEEGVDYLYGRGGFDKLDGGKQFDVLDGGLGGDTIDAGDDGGVASYAGRTKAVSVDLTQSGGDGEAGEGDNVLPTVDDITGGSGSDTLKGNGEVNHINGREGADKIWGRGGNDDLLGMSGNDTIHGDAGADGLFGSAGVDYLYGGTEDDHMYGGNENDRIYGESGADTISGNAGADYLYGGVGVFDDELDGGYGADFMSAGPGSDHVSYASRINSVSITIGAGNGDDGEAGEGDTVDQTIERVTGGTKADTLVGSDVANVLKGGAGGDTIEGLGGADQLFGQAGGDTMKAVDSIQDAVDCGADADTVQADAIDTLTACETVQVPMGPGNGGQGNGGQGNGGQPQAQAAGPKVGLALASSRVTKGGSARIRITCPKSAKAFCQGTLRLSRSGRRVGSKAFTVKAGRSAVVSVKVAFSARKAMRATRTARAKGITIRATAVAHGQGTKSRTTTKLVRIKGVAKR
jgi:Ca2+-binding RTX toxin-like protein